MKLRNYVKLLLFFLLIMGLPVAGQCAEEAVVTADSAKTLDVALDEQGKMTVTVPAKSPVIFAPADEEETVEAPNSEAYLAAEGEFAEEGESVAAYSFSDAGEMRPIVSSRNPQTQVELGFENYVYKYEEPNFMRLDGNFYGVFGTLSHRFHENPVVRDWQDIFNPNSSINMIKLDARFAYGNLDYESQGTGNHEGEDNYVFNIKGVLGYDLNFTPTFRMTPYVGLGWRYLLDDNGGTVTDAGYYGYDRESTYAYIPIGMDFRHQLKEGWSFSYGAEYDFLVDGTQKSHLGDVDFGYETLENDQNSGYGVESYFRVMKDMERFGIFIQPFVRYWHIDDSDVSAVIYSGAVDGYGLEPENKTLEYGVRLGASF